MIEQMPCGGPHPHRGYIIIRMVGTDSLSIPISGNALPVTQNKGREENRHMKVRLPSCVFLYNRPPLLSDN